jgi:hypothetical protein
MQLEILENLDFAIVHITSQNNSINRSAVLLYLLAKQISENKLTTKIVVAAGAEVEVESTVMSNVKSIVQWCENKFSDISIDTRFYRFMKPEKEIKSNPDLLFQHRVSTSEAFFEEALASVDNSAKITIYTEAPVTRNSISKGGNYISFNAPFVGMSNDEVLALCPDILL